MHFYQQQTMATPPVKLGLPLLLNLYTNPREDEEKFARETWILGPMLKMVGEFEASVKAYPLMPTGTPAPYQPRPAQP